MDLIYVVYTLIFISSDYIIIHAIDEDTGGRFQNGELNEEESQLETKSGEGNKLSALDGTVSEGDSNTSPNDESQDELSEEYKSYEAVDEADSGNVTGPGKKLVIYQWRNGIVPYCVDEHSYDIVIYRRIQKALDAIQSASCLVFKPIPKPRSGNSFVYFTNPNKERECVHTLSAGRRGEPVVVLGYDCMQERDIIHSIMHLLGFRDEVTHPHRDSYIRIMWNNIQPKYRLLFTIDTKPSWTHKLAEYDTLSIMHFHDRAFSINGGHTILPLLPDRIINPTDKLSLLDKMKLRIAFEKECNRRQVHFLVETCKNYARDDKNTKDHATEDLCAFDKFKVTTIKYIQNGKQNNERLTGVVGVQVGKIRNEGKNINNINGINGNNVIEKNKGQDMVGVNIDELDSIKGDVINNINGINDGIIPNQKVLLKNERLTGVVGVQVGKIRNEGKNINNINGINGNNVIEKNKGQDMVGVNIDELDSIKGDVINNINGINDGIIPNQNVLLKNEAISGVHIEKIQNENKMINNIYGINGNNFIENNRGSDIVGIRLDEINNKGDVINNIYGINDDIIGNQTVIPGNIINNDKESTTQSINTTSIAYEYDL